MGLSDADLAYANCFEQGGASGIAAGRLRAMHQRADSSSERALIDRAIATPATADEAAGIRLRVTALEESGARAQQAEHGARHLAQAHRYNGATYEEAKAAEEKYLADRRAKVQADMAELANLRQRLTQLEEGSA